MSMKELLGFYLLLAGLKFSRIVFVDGERVEVDEATYEFGNLLYGHYLWLTTKRGWSAKAEQ